MTEFTSIANYEYGPFGEVIRATGPAAKLNPLRFSTKFTDDETGLLYYGHRYYNPSTGRWPSRDPIEEIGFQLFSSSFGENQSPDDTANLYSFVDNSPVGSVDCIGLTCKIVPCDKITDCKARCWCEYGNRTCQGELDAAKCVEVSYAFCIARGGGFACWFWASVVCGDKAAGDQIAAGAAYAGCLSGCPCPKKQPPRPPPVPPSHHPVHRPPIQILPIHFPPIRFPFPISL
jgi:RHS repeat-associated protein